jgi:pimeloyl-ACP methyl ester carboxylesterase
VSAAPGHRCAARAAIGVGLASLLLAALTMLQNHLLYFPARGSVADMESATLRAWPSADDYRGLLAEPDGSARVTVIVFHGNAGHAGHRDYYATALTRLGLRVLLAEYPGYGPREGRLGEASLVADAEETIVRAAQQYGAPLLIVGESLGAGVAAAAAARHEEHVAGLLLVTPWDRLESVARHHYPWLPVGWLLRDRYDSAAHLASFARPVMIALAEHDDIVPADFGRALHASLKAPKRLLVMAGAGHNRWASSADERWWREALSFLLAGPGSSSSR